MGLLTWRRGWRARSEANRRSLAVSDDEEAIGRLAPEVAGMGFVKGGAFVLAQLDRFNETATPEHSAELAGRLLGSQEAWKRDGLTMPWWGNLVVLRALEAEIAEGRFR